MFDTLCRLRLPTRLFMTGNPAKIDRAGCSSHQTLPSGTEH